MVVPLPYVFHHVNVQSGFVKELFFTNGAFYVLLFQMQPSNVIFHVRVPSEEPIAKRAFMARSVGIYQMFLS